jgi:D-alanyl-D-alanine carboxypeptidase/D-alanyl-D-alanine-endopeptidase (penicillin-binding protein 4)
MNKVYLVFTLVSLLFLPACFSSQSSNQTENSQPPDAETFPIPNAEINLAKPLEISRQPKDVALCGRINRTIEQSEHANARWGVIAVSLKDGRIVCGRDERKLFNPASIQKVLTAIVALDKLGAEFRFRTSVYGARAIENGILDGDLTIYGRGAPDFDGASLENLVAQLEAKGLKHIKGNVVGDESYFTGDGFGDGWTWNDLQWYYGAEASAVTFKQNEADVYMHDGAPVSSSDYLEIQSDLQPKQADKTESYGIRRGLGNNQIYVWGSGEKASGRMSVHNPTLWTAKTLKETLEKRGIVVEGTAQSVDWTAKNKLVVENHVELAAVESVTLAEIVQKMNKRSVNIYAELLLRTLGKQFGASAPDENRQMQEVRGDDAAGTSVIKKFLRDNKVATEEIQIHDGSGLSRLNFVTSEAYARALIYAAQSNFSNAFINSLPIAATDGTLGGRLGKAKGKITAKTGSITFVNSLAGYAQTPDNEVLSFAIISNNVTKKSDSSSVIDAVATSLTQEEEEKSEKVKK